MTMRVLLLGPAAAGLVEIALPMNFAFETPNRGLGVRLDQQTQTGFHGCFLGLRAAVPHRLAHQAVINVYVSPHHHCLSDV
jgi:hypothetical protein